MPAAHGEMVAGTYRQRLTLTSGRFAMIDNGLGFALVPWTDKHKARLWTGPFGFGRGEVISAGRGSSESHRRAADCARRTPPQTGCLNFPSRLCLATIFGW
jgi:Protein of unknown function (DUF3363)